MNLFNFFKKKKIKLDDKLQEEVQAKRDSHKSALRERLKKYHLNDEELDKLFEIIQNAEKLMDEIKLEYDYSKNRPQDLIDMKDRIIKVQKKMEEDFNNNLNILLKEKYIKAKEILEKDNNKN